MIAAILLMGGRSLRFGKDKLLVEINGKPVWQYSLDTFLSHSRINSIVVVGKKLKLDRTHHTEKPILFTQAGQERMFSVYNGLCRLKEVFSPQCVLVHDAARPAVSSELIDRVIDATLQYGACVPGLPISFTVKKMQKRGHYVARTLSRTSLIEVQTPQGFLFDKLYLAYCEAIKAGQVFTDDSAVWEKFVKEPVFVCEGDRKNIKLTYKEDLFFLEAVLK